jgi:hypothetical protein
VNMSRVWYLLSWVAVNWTWLLGPLGGVGLDGW